MLDTILLVAALVCFVAAAVNVRLGSLNLIAAGLALYVLAALV